MLKGENFCRPKEEKGNLNTLGRVVFQPWKEGASNRFNFIKKVGKGLHRRISKCNVKLSSTCLTKAHMVEASY